MAGTPFFKLPQAALSPDVISDPSSQFELFAAGGSDADLIGTVPLPAELEAAARQLPPALRLGTASWAFPGWTGIVYAQRVGDQMLAGHGLAAYARHPLLRAVGIDRTF